jgi:NAD(P)-dependent dehydrogenase (short-subunit alcohol dehydrogenase family)
MSQLDGKVAVITGAASGIGLAAVRLFASEGARVYAAGHPAAQLKDGLAAVAGDVTAVDCDTADTDGLARLAEAVRSGAGRADVLYAAADSGVPRVPLPEVTGEDFDSVFAVNTRGTLFTVQRLLPVLADGASVVINGSAGVVKGTPGTTVYAASKAALRSFARTWAAELAGRRIRVNLLSLGVIDLGPGDGVPAALKEQLAAGIPLGRLGDPAEVARAALFLASDASSFVTGSELAVDGGMTQV